MKTVNAPTRRITPLNCTQLQLNKYYKQNEKTYRKYRQYKNSRVGKILITETTKIVQKEVTQENDYEHIRQNESEEVFVVDKESTR